jgi:hypothetical protein
MLLITWDKYPEVNEDSDLVNPSGITKLLQPFNVVINRPSKVTLAALQPVDDDHEA